jgi:regulator of sirC expression with transglutaminase-like and TPR domain
VDALRELLTSRSSRVTLDVAALELARFEHPNLDPAPWLRELDRIAFEITGRAADLDDGACFIRATNSYLFEELQFHGNEANYYDPRNSCLNDVLAFRTGLPITLSLVYMETARRLAKPVFGIGAPGHFLVEFNDGKLSVFIDAFNRGRTMSREQCLMMAGEYTRGRVAGDVLPRLSPRQIILRMLRNLESAYVRLNDFERAVAVSDLLRLAGEAPPLPRYRPGGN